MVCQTRLLKKNLCTYTHTHNKQTYSVIVFFNTMSLPNIANYGSHANCYDFLIFIVFISPCIFNICHIHAHIHIFYSPTCHLPQGLHSEKFPSNRLESNSQATWPLTQMTKRPAYKLKMLCHKPFINHYCCCCLFVLLYSGLICIFRSCRLVS